MLPLCHVTLSDGFYYTRQATPAIAVISARRSESNSRGETSSCFKGDFYVTIRETGEEQRWRVRSQSEDIWHLEFWAMRSDRLTEHLARG